MFSRQFVEWDADVVDSMVSFPLHKFDTPPIAFLPIRSATCERFVAVIELEGRVSCVSPSINAIHSVTRILEDDDTQDDTHVCGIAVHEAELCLVLYEGTTGVYRAHFLKAQRTAFTSLGAVTLLHPDPSVFLCGVTHLGAALCVVWSDGSVQIYKPNVGEGLVLTRVFKLTGFDFVAMKRGAGTEDMRQVMGEISVCSTLNVHGVVCIVGPETETLRLKYVVLDVESGLVQRNGILEEPMKADAPIRIASVMNKSGAFRLFVGKEDHGTKSIHMKATTLATRVGSKTVSLKRKLDEDDVPCSVQSDCYMTLSRPQWDHLLASTKSNASESTDLERRVLKKICRKQPVNGIVPSNDNSFDRRVSNCMKQLQDALKAEEQRSGCIAEVKEVLKESRESGKVLLIDLSGVAAEYIGCRCRDWESLREILELNAPESLTFCPTLPGTLLKAHQFDLLVQFLSGLKRLALDHFSSLLWIVLSRSEDTEDVALQANAMERTHTSLAASLDEANGMDEVPFEVYNALKWRALAFNGFSFRGLLLHALLSIPTNLSDLQLSLATFDRDQLRFVMEYLRRWLQITRNEIQQPQSVQDMECIIKIPSTHNVVDWISCLLSLHMTTFRNDSVLLQIMSDIQKEMQWVKPDTKLFLTANSLCKEVLRPRRKKKRQNTFYQVEVFDLSFC